jgi:transcriptional regulator GlxA family with amidase domain
MHPVGAPGPAVREVLDAVLTPAAGSLTARTAGQDDPVSASSEDSNRRMLRARDVMDRDYALPLDVPGLARVAHVSEAHFIRTFRATFGETPHRYLQRRRVERAMWLLRSSDRTVTDVCMAVGFSSLGTFSRVFAEVVGEPPSVYRRRGPLAPVPSCFGMRWLRPGSNGAVSEKPAGSPRL